MTLSDTEKKVYEWQIWVPGFGETGQEKLRESTVFLSRLGGLGGVVAYELAAAGIGAMQIAHAGNIKHSDLNRQLLMTWNALGTSRVKSAITRLNELNPRLKINGFEENVSSDNVDRVAAGSDIIIDCAPLFEERFAMNHFAVQNRLPLVECAMYEMEAQITSIIPGKTPCLRCLHPGKPPKWKRQFPVFGAVSGTVGCMAAIEAIKILTGLGNPLYGELLSMDLKTMEFRKLKIRKNPNCPDCGHL